MHKKGKKRAKEAKESEEENQEDEKAEDSNHAYTLDLPPSPNSVGFIYLD